MPKKKSKHRNTADRNHEEIVFKGDDQYYAVVTKSLGCGRFEITCDDGIERIGKLRGNMRKSQWVTTQSIVLVSLREFTDSNKADVLLKYSEYAIRQLRRYGELEWMTETKKVDEGASDDELVVFEDDEEIDRI